MTRPSRLAAVSVCLCLAVLAAACGRSSFSPTSPTGIGRNGTGSGSGAVITGTVSGEALTASTESTFSTATTSNIAPVTVTVVGTDLSATLDSRRKFTLEGVPTGDVQLHFEGAGIDATITLLDVEEGDRIDVSVRVTGSRVRIEAVRREPRRDDDDDDDDDDDNDGPRSGTEVEGVVAGLTGTCPAITFTVGEVSVTTTTLTRFEDGTCAQIQNGTRVEVRGLRQSDNSLAAARVEIDD